LEGQNLSQLETLGEGWGLAPSDKAIVFIDNHDKQRGHGGGGNYLTYKNGKLYELANVFMLAHPYGYPALMSSYTFSDSEQGPPADAEGNTHSVYMNGEVSCFAEWQCEHRWQAIANMVSFRNYTSAESLTHWWSNGANQIAFGRGDKGFVVINRESDRFTHTLQTDMAPGTYCNVIEGELNADGTGCTATGANATVTVDRHRRVTVTVEGMGAIAIHRGAKVS
ncbi:MAG: ATPase, partial [Leptolyngbyaceae cyanobacterium SL_5_9]|nr:ATPase [Leptolyngbyaceae cyanobacterium SL_5_9]